MQIIAAAIQKTAAATMTPATEVDLLPGGSSGWALMGGDTVVVALAETAGVLVDTVKVYISGGNNGIGGNTPGSIGSGTAQLLPLSASTSLGASGTRSIVLRGAPGALIRVTGNSTAGSSAVTADVSSFTSGLQNVPLQVSYDGVLQGTATGGTITGNASVSGGTIALNSTGATTIDASTSTTIAGTSGTLVLGRTAIAPSLPGGLTIAAAKTIDVTAAGTLQIGTSTATAMTLGAAGFANSNPGGITIGSGKAVTGAGAMAVEAAAASTLTVGAASNAMVIGQAAKVATVNGDADFQGLFKGHVVDAGAAATSGTASGTFVTFTLSSGSSAYTLTNTKIATTSLLLCTVISTGAVAAYILNAVPGNGSAVITFSGAVGVNTKVAVMVINAGA